LCRDIEAKAEAEACGAGAAGRAGAANETILVAAAALVAATLVRGEMQLFGLFGPPKLTPLLEPREPS
jgi:hypothetical protein